VLLIKQNERNSKQLNLILNQINVIIYSHLGFFKFYQPKATRSGFFDF
jgi:hypothetical protein